MSGAIKCGQIVRLCLGYAMGTPPAYLEHGEVAVLQPRADGNLL